MNTFSIMALIVIALCVAYIVYCIYGASRLSRRNKKAHKEPPDTASGIHIAENNPTSDININQ